MFRKNFYSFVPASNTPDDCALMHNGQRIGYHWPDLDGWTSIHPACKKGLIYFCVGNFRGFAYSVKDARATMMTLAKAEVERVRKSRKRK